MTPPRRLAFNEACAIPRARLRVFVDGDMLRDVVVYDCDKGEATVIAHDDNGNRISIGDRWLCQEVAGNVTVRVVE